ncbi:hypothetical protein B0H63DRAFT_444927 [Podospora didyma]|uniref:N-acetyltransferase domain-containing protein n=1 Tax=Podospora didyma TaxID=330526 RepID=A0AAE0P7Q6_9PEZI|nr:hypothetical protein B0H63DRAFT_444927 [Podospora didyma]
MEESLQDLVSPLREASRKLVREWGFLRPSLAGSVLSPVAVHCLIEIGDRNVHTISRLCSDLQISEGQLRRTLEELISRGDITPEQQLQVGEEDTTTYCLAAQGAQTLRSINKYAEGQVTKALAATPPGTGTDITTAFRIYAAALEAARRDEVTPPRTPVSTPPAPTPDELLIPSLVAQVPTNVTIVTGYRPGILGRPLEMHLDFYSRQMGWGRAFEAWLASSMSAFLTRLDKPINEAWAAVQSVPSSGMYATTVERIVGVIFIDGESADHEPGEVAHIRAFIVDDSTRGLGLGKKLLAAAMNFVREGNFKECRLSTSRILQTAIALYKREGFQEANESWSDRTGDGHMILEMVWHRDNPGEV